MADKKILTCEGCPALCCRYVGLEIDEPETKEDFENIKWYVAHENVEVYVDEDGSWNIEFKTRCKYLGNDNKCKIYEKRPKICRDYSQDQCPFHNEYKPKIIFRDIEDVEKYVREVFNDS